MTLPPAPYTRPQTLPLVTANERAYVLTFRDIPDEDRPRERLRTEGPLTLSTPELIAILLSVGTTKEDVLSMATRISRDYGERSILEERSPERLAREAGIPLGKAERIVAAGELGRRFYQKNTATLPIVRTARDVFEHVTDMRTLTKEHLRGLYLNARYKVVHDEVLSIGTIDANLVHPREVFRPAIEHAAAAIILVHNHPAGDAEPSAADIAVTEQIIAAGRLIGIELIDHVIVTSDTYMSVPASYNQG
jgi:DNA repair protein RadC